MKFRKRLLEIVTGGIHLFSFEFVKLAEFLTKSSTRSKPSNRKFHRFVWDHVGQRIQCENARREKSLERIFSVKGRDFLERDSGEESSTNRTDGTDGTSTQIGTLE